MYKSPQPWRRPSLWWSRSDTTSRGWRLLVVVALRRAAVVKRIGPVAARRCGHRVVARLADGRMGGTLLTGGGGRVAGWWLGRWLEDGGAEGKEVECGLSCGMAAPLIWILGGEFQSKEMELAYEPHIFTVKATVLAISALMGGPSLS
ncbi:hypothetical protein VPH35_081884 [Triticum aestivum]